MWNHCEQAHNNNNKGLCRPLTRCHTGDYSTNCTTTGLEDLLTTHQWIASWLSERFQKVVLDGQASDPVPVLSGVPQGSVLGPVIFLIFINDLPDNIRSSVRLFADDCVLYRNIKTPTDCQILPDDLNSLGQLETDWQMKFNVVKCHSMRVTWHFPSNQLHFNYSLHQQTLEQVESTKYLGNYYY